MKITLKVLFLLILVADLHGEVKVKVKNLCMVDGYKYNQVYGYGLVVGLPGTGDSKTALTKDSIKNLLETLGIRTEQPVIRNIAAVLITARLEPHTRKGDRVDVLVSSIGDAKSLEGGLLIQSSLKGADGKIYVVAQGRLESPEVNDRKSKGLTVLPINNGGIAERSVRPSFVFKEKKKNEGKDEEERFFIRLNLKKWDYTNADKIVKSINNVYKGLGAFAGRDGKIIVPIAKEPPLSEFMSKILNIEIEPEIRARVVIDQVSGVIVSGGHVQVSESMVSRNGMTMEIEGSFVGFNRGKNSALLKDLTTVKDIVDTLNAIGAKTGDIIAILKALKESGSLHAELIVK